MTSPVLDPNRGLGAIYSPPDPALPKFHESRLAMPAASLPSYLGLLPADWPVGNQGGQNECTAFASVAAALFLLRKFCPWLSDFFVSQAANYYWARAYYGMEAYDGGAFTNVAFALQAGGLTIPGGGGGCADYSLWPYTQPVNLRPAPGVATDGRRRLLGPMSVVYNSDINNIKQAIAAGFPVVFDFDVPMSWYAGPEAVMSWPASGYFGMRHAMVIVGYDDSYPFGTTRGGCEILGSWGEGVGFRGRHWFPYEFIASTRCSPGYMADRVIVDGVGYPRPPAPTRTLTWAGGLRTEMLQRDDGSLVFSKLLP